MPYLNAADGGGPANIYWNFNDPRGNGSYTNYFSGYETGALVGGVFTPGADLGGAYPCDASNVLNGALIPEPTTLALLALGAIAFLRRRKENAAKE
jgi:hypothetical protein